MKNLIHKLACLGPLLGTALAPAPAWAEGVLNLDPYVSAAVTHDDNVFRFSGKEEALAQLGEEKMSDTITVLSAGINARLELGRQVFSASYGKSRSRYEHFTFQDNEGETQNLAWNWRMGNHLSGEISHSESISQSGFTEFQSTQLNLRTTKNDVYRASWELHPRWVASASHEKITSENSTFDTSDREERTESISLAYRTPKDSELSLSLRQRETEFPGRSPVLKLLYGDSNLHREIAFKGKWHPGGKLQINGQLAFFKREGEGPLAQEFQDVNSRLDANWQATGKASLAASVWQEFRLADDLNIGFSRVRGLRLGPVWQPATKILVQADATQEQVTYLEGARDEETLNSYGVSTSYSPHEKVSMQLGWRHEARETGNVLSGYRSNSLNASVRINF